ncbi:MAG TPA: ester cyclase [Acidimicrobiales bacterium]|jgi:predicted ester cyclase|nr:ester cyclase [Acidimicrobiales bacterium]
MSGHRTPKEVVERFLNDGSTDGEWNMDVIEECFDPSYFSHTWQGDLAHTGARQARWFGAFEYLEKLDDHLVAEGDLVVHHRRNRVRHIGDALGVQATGRELEIDHIEMWRVRDGKIVEHWGGSGVGHQIRRALTVPPKV